MKKLASLLLGCFITFSFTGLAGPSEADEKWLQAVEKMIAKGEQKISTPNESRVTLLKEWGEKNGYSVKVTKVDEKFSIEVTGKGRSTDHVAQK